MEPQINIGSHAFAAYSVTEAIAQAVEKARELRETGELVEAEALYAAAEHARVEFQSALGTQRDAKRPVSRTTERWQRRVGMLYGSRRR